MGVEALGCDLSWPQQEFLGHGAFAPTANDHGVRLLTPAAVVGGLVASGHVKVGSFAVQRHSKSPDTGGRTQLASWRHPSMPATAALGSREEPAGSSAYVKQCAWLSAPRRLDGCKMPIAEAQL